MITRRALLGVVRSALREVDVGPRTVEALRVGPEERLRVVAIGKASVTMARAVLGRWASQVEHAVVVAPDGVDVRPLEEGAARLPRGLASIEVLRASHPAPDARSVRAAKRCFAAVRSEEPQHVLVLVSGGASALVCAPADGVSLRTKRAVVDAMLRSGAPIAEINVVRKHLSRIKGGGLLRAAYPNRVSVAAVSDVVHGSISDIGSGPAVADDSTVADARRLLRRWAPSFAGVTLVRTLGPRSREARAARASVVASPEDLASRVARKLAALGIQARAMSPSSRDVERLALAYASAARRMPSNTALVRAAEPSVVVPEGAGRGGRSTHLAALVARGLPPHCTFLAFATDGVDGASGTGGAILDGSYRRRSAAALDAAIAAFDTGALHRAYGAALPERPTGHNFADLHVLIAGPP